MLRQGRRQQAADYMTQLIDASVLGQVGRIGEANQQFVAAAAKEPNLSASGVLPSWIRAMFEEGRENFMDGLRKAGLPE